MKSRYLKSFETKPYAIKFLLIVSISSGLNDSSKLRMTSCSISLRDLTPLLTGLRIFRPRILLTSSRISLVAAITSAVLADGEGDGLTPFGRAGCCATELEQ